MLFGSSLYYLKLTHSKFPGLAVGRREGLGLGPRDKTIIEATVAAAANANKGVDKPETARAATTAAPATNEADGIKSMIADITW
jgi:hypothetical protein